MYWEIKRLFCDVMVEARAGTHECECHARFHLGCLAGRKGSACYGGRNFRKKKSEGQVGGVTSRRCGMGMGIIVGAA